MCSIITLPMFNATTESFEAHLGTLKRVILIRDKKIHTLA